MSTPRQETETPETLRSAAARARERGEAAESLRLYLQAAQRAEGVPTAARVKSSIDVELGDLYERDLGRLDLAVERYERAYKENPDDARAVEAGRRLYRALGDWQRVARLFEVELESAHLTPAQRSALLVELGVVLSEHLGDVVQAAVRFEEAARINNADEVARERLAELYTSADFPGDDGAPLERAARLLCELALMRRMKNDDEAELAFLRRALGADPYLVDAAVRLEQVLRARGKNDELKRLYRDAPLPNRPLKEGELLLQIGELDDAGEALIVAAEEGLDVSDPRSKLTALYSEKKAWAKLASFEERLVEVLGPDATQLVALAKHHQQAGNLAGYENALKRALSLDPTHETALPLLAEHLVARRDPNGIAAAWEAAIEASAIEDQPRRLAELADIYEKRVGDVAAAADAWRRAEAIVPSEKGASEIKRLQQKEDRWAHLCAALEKELQAAAAPEQRAELLRRLAQVYRDRHQIDRARQLFEESSRLKPEDPAALRALADLAEREGDFAALAAAIKRQLGVSKEKVERLNLLRRLAVLYDERIDDPEELLWACSEILTALPGDRDALRRLETAYERAGAEDQLIGILEKHAQAAATPAEKGPLLHRLAALYEAHEEPEKAAERLDRVLKLDKHDAAAQEGLARLYEKLGKWPEAALALERLVVKDNLDAWKRLARVVDGKLSDAARAAKAWSEVLQRRPSDREALEALARLYRARGDWSHLNDILGRRQKTAEGEELAELALERARLLDEHLRDKPGAIAILRALLDGTAPRHLAAHELLRKLERESGDLGASQRTAERELFLTEEPRARLALALEIATRWRDEGKDLVRAIAAFERVIEIEDTHTDGLAALAELYSLAGEPEKLVAVDEQRLAMALEAQNKPQAVAHLFELALTCEEQLHDADSAFGYFQKAHELDAESGALNELRRVAEAHGLWEKLCDIYAAMPGLEPRLQVAEIADGRMNDSKRAFAVVRGALDLDPTGEKIQAELERLSVRAGDPRGLLEIYDLLLQRRPEPSAQVALLSSRAQVKELRQNDASGAMDEMLRAYSLIPDDQKILPELLRLGQVTARWEDVLAVEGFRFHNAPQGSTEKLHIACEAAALVEEKLQDRLRAFRAYLRAYMLSPDDEIIRGHLWRLARRLDTIDESAQIDLGPAKPPPIPGKRRDETQELELIDVEMEEVPEPAKKKPRKDPTVELSIMDLVAIQQSEPINLFPEEKKPKHAPPPTPRAVSGQHSAWDELASVMMTLPAKDADTRFRRLVAVAEMWERGAGDLGHAFDTLASAFRLNPDDPEARAALERLAEANDAWDRLVAVLDETLEETGEADRVVRLLLDSASVREKQKQMPDVEARLHRALGIQPACEEALVKLETLYRKTERLGDLTGLLERRLGGLLERLPPGDQRKLRALELADVYERLGNTYEAISAWQRVAQENPDHAAAFLSLARLYESVGQWSKVIESHTREIDVLETQKAGSERARALRKRVGEIFLKELELPDRAAEAFAALHELNPGDQEVEAALEKLFEKLGRWSDLDALLRRRGDRWGDAVQKAQILERRATLLKEKLHDDEGTLGVLSQLRKLRPEDDAIAARTGAILQKLGKREEAMALLRERVPKSGPKKSELLVELAQLEADFGDFGAAQKSLEKALAEKPDDPRALAELARLREGGSDWDGYASAREREAEVAATKEAAVRALLDAARVHLDKRKDDAAAKKTLERALEKDANFPETLGLLQNLYRRTGVPVLIERADELAQRELSLSPQPERKAELQSLLGRSLLDKGKVEAATMLFREALALRPGWAPAVHGLVDVAVQTNAWDEVAVLLKSATAKEGVPPEIAAQFYRRLAEAEDHQGRPDEAYAALLEADRLLPGDLTTRLAMGENRYRGNRFREAAQHLTAVAEHSNAASLGKAAGEGAYHAALSELKMRRAEKAMALVEIAVRLDPQHVAALGLLAERAIETGDVERALGLFERQAAATSDLSERLSRFEKVGDVIRSELRDEKRAMAAFERAMEAGGENASTALLDKLLGLERDAGNLPRASELAAKLVDRATQKPERARRLREAAALDAALGKNDLAVERLRQALELDPLAHEALAGLSALLVAQGGDEEAAQLLTRALPMLPAPEESGRAARAVLWMRLGECRERLRDLKGAVAAFEKALEADPTRRPLRETLLQRYGDDPGHDDVVRAHHLRILAEDPLHAQSLRAVARIDQRSGQKRPDQGRRFLELLAVAGALSDDEKRRLASMPAGLDEAKVGTLAEEDHAALAHPSALPLAPVFAAMWEGSSSMTPDLNAMGLHAGNRVSPVDKTELALAYALASRILGNRKTGLYLKVDSNEVTVMAHPPTAIVVSPRLPEGRSAADVRFLLGRALEIARPEYVLAAALSREDFTKLFGALLRAFHPRHARRTGDDEAAAWRKQLPYKVARRLGELFRDLGDTPFSSVDWRRAVQHTANRAGLLASGDVIAAARVLNAEGDAEAVRELARFAASDDYAALRTRLRL